PFLRFAFEGRAYQYKVLPFGLSLSPRVFTKLAEGALAPLWGQGICILNYLDDWLIIAHSRDLLCQHRDLVLQHFSHLGLRVNWEKSKHLFSRHGAGFGQHDSTSHERARTVNAELSKTLQTQNSGPSQILPEAPGAYGSRNRCNATRLAPYETASALATRPNPEMGMAPQYLPGRRYSGPLRSYGREHIVVNTDASTTGWGAVCNGQAASGSWTGPRLR
ncbi:hypothetical protein M9458_021325, partial [Cirrhinus mrigala]